FLSHDLQADFGVAVPLSYRAPDNERRSPRFLFTLSSAFRLCPERGRGGCIEPRGRWPQRGLFDTALTDLPKFNPVTCS
ncbi:hypothetical protein ABTK78_20730, partial [Acinetobacter baumannii]